MRKLFKPRSLPMQQQTSSPKITFRVSENEIPESPKLSAIALQEMSRQLGLEEIAIEIEMQNIMEYPFMTLYLCCCYISSYGVTSIAGLASKAKKAYK